MSEEKRMPLLFQTLPLGSKKRRLKRRYSGTIRPRNRAAQRRRWWRKDSMFSRIALCKLACALGTVLTLAATPSRAGDSPLRVLILSADGSYVSRTTTPILKHLLAATERFDVRLCESPAGLTAKAFEGFDLLVDNGAGLTPGDDTEEAIANFVKSGKGLVVTRGGLGVSVSPEFWPARASGRADPDVKFLDVLARREHPIVAGMNARFRTADSLPPGIIVHPDSETIATATSSTGGNQQEPVVVASRFGKGRVVLFALGCDASALHEPQSIAMFSRASEWAATGAVTLPAEYRPSRPGPGAVKGLLITGGHDHEATFYSLFEGYNDLGWLPVDTSANAFKKDLRSKYDVLIMYDFSRDLDEAGKKNLRDFVESGKGVVVLHHALLNYQTWSWWSEEVVGGRYRLQREGEAPSSGVKDAQQIFASPAEPHPVLEGIAPFHITDEAYKNLYMSSRIRPLLTTNNPTSDVNLAWIGPCETSRVVAIQLGHGHSAFQHPSYRGLVHNAVLWAAGKKR
jgi:type 1 glutamine amidotransferase